MSRKTLRKILEDIGAGKDIVPLFLEARKPPSQVYWALKYFLENPDTVLTRKVASRYKVDTQYLIDRASDIIEKIDKFRKTNPYAVLNLTYHADASEIRNNWKALLKEWHPDRQRNEGESLAVAQRINDAYLTLKTQESRKAYDKQYAPFLAIVKDIEDHPFPLFQQNGRRPVLKVFLLGGVLFLVGVAYLLSIEPHQPGHSVLSHYGAPRKVFHPRSKAKTKVYTADLAVPVGEGSRGGDRPVKEDQKAQNTKLVEKRDVLHHPMKTRTGTKRAKREEKVVLKIKSCRGYPGRGSDPSLFHAPVDFIFSSLLVQVRVKGKPQAGGYHHLKGRVALAIPKREAKKKISSNGKVLPKQERKQLEDPFNKPKRVIKRYFECYRRGDFKTLATLFDEEAVENGIPVRETMGNYRTFFRCLRVLRFDFEERKSLKKKNRYFVDGSYVIEYKKSSGEKKFRNVGGISFVVVRNEKNAWLIKDVEYDSSGLK